MSWVSVGRGWQKKLLCGKTQLKSTFSHQKCSVSSLHNYVFNRSYSNTLSRWKYINGLTGIFVFSTSCPHTITLLAEPSWTDLGFSLLPIRGSVQFPSHFLHLAAPTSVLTRQQRLWKWGTGEQVTITQYCALPSLPPSFHKVLWLRLLPSHPSWWWQPDELEEAVGNRKSAEHRQWEWKQLPARFTAFAHRPLLKIGVATKTLQACTASAFMGH